jgi:cytoskeletal protein CcmA (bactofilin family)
MFGNNHKKNGKLEKTNQHKNATINIIGKGTQIEGQIQAEGDIRVDGTLHGNIYSKSKVVIGKSGTVKGDITCQNADVLGAVEGGTIKIRQLLTLKETAHIEAEITTKKLVVEPGAQFNGNCQMGELVEAEKEGQQDGESKQKGKKAKAKQS